MLKGKRKFYCFLKKEQKTSKRISEMIPERKIPGDRYPVDLKIFPATQEKEQTNILELMGIDNGKNRHHRIRWGWSGTHMLIKSSIRKINE